MTENRPNADKMLDRVQATAEAQREQGIEPEGSTRVDPTRIVINGVPQSMHRELQALAFRSKSSVSRLGLLALEQLLLRSRDGSLPLLPPQPAEDDA